MDVLRYSLRMGRSVTIILTYISLLAVVDVLRYSLRMGRPLTLTLCLPPDQVTYYRNRGIEKNKEKYIHTKNRNKHKML